MIVKRLDLFKRLDDLCFKAMESATVLCKMRGNPYVDLAHLLNQILLGENSDLHVLVRHFSMNLESLAHDLNNALNRLPQGALSIRDFAPEIEQMIKDGWLISSLVQQQTKIRSGHLILACKQDQELNRKLLSISEQFKFINADILSDNFNSILSESDEGIVVQKSLQSETVTTTTTGQAAKLINSDNRNNVSAAQEALRLYTVDLTAKAEANEIEDIVGRDAEIRQIIDVLLRRRQNNPIITGEAGVGKTAVVEGFAMRLAKGDVPPALKGARLLSLDLGLLQAGASMKGEFENRLKEVIIGVKNSDMPTILFIDEAHTLIGAGGAAGQNDAANLLKPALARGELRCIGATTYKEFVKYFEKDPALTRRFENIKIDEPSDETAIKMLRHMVGSLEQHHKVEILDESIQAAVKLSRRYIPSRQLPDKAVSILDTACSMVALSQCATPDELDYLQREIVGIKAEQFKLGKEQKEGIDHSERLDKLNSMLLSTEKSLNDLQAKYEQEQQLFNAFLKAKDAYRKSLDCAEEVANLAALKQARDDLYKIQGDNQLIQPEVDVQAVSKVISQWTGIPITRMVSDEIKGVLDLKDQLCANVIGQDHALMLLARRMVTARANLADPSRPIAVLMFAGPSGVGKTETAISLAQQMYGSEQNLITINMSEFQESHTVSSLKGAPPGYVGYGEGGVLTEAVRRRPYSVVLLDEVEKAHKDVHELFFQVFDKGRMDDGSGRQIDFTNTVILLTTNVGDDTIMRMCADAIDADDETLLPSVEKLELAIRPDMLRVFPAALLGRINIIPFYPLGQAALRKIINLKLNKVIKRVEENYHASVKIDDTLYQEIIARCQNVASGARLIDAIINNDILPDVATLFLEALLEKQSINGICLAANAGKFVVSQDCMSV